MNPLNKAEYPRGLVWFFQSFPLGSLSVYPSQFGNRVMKDCVSCIVSRKTIAFKTFIGCTQIFSHLLPDTCCSIKTSCRKLRIEFCKLLLSLISKVFLFCVLKLQWVRIARAQIVVVEILWDEMSWQRCPCHSLEGKFTCYCMFCMFCRWTLRRAEVFV